MTYRFKTPLSWADVTPKAAFLNRRQLMAGAAALMATPALARLSYTPSAYSTDEAPNTFEEISGYNNFYEFGTAKEDPRNNSGAFKPDPWAVQIDGLVERPGSYDLADILGGVALEERIYRLRCVEAWSMVVPWIGFQLSALLDRVGVQPGAKYVAFETVTRPEEMPGQRRAILDWPYREGLRIDEAMHPLTILATGLYGEVLPNQNGAPIRLVVPWKYGFKSAKSIVTIRLTETQPATAWNKAAAQEYGFYSNVNPAVSHPRWSQATERRIGELRKRPTLPFNGYADQVAGLYQGMDLKKFF